MKNRKLSSPILCALVLSLVAHPPLLSQAEPVVSSAASTVVSASPTTMTPATAHTSSYTVVAGDSLTSIAKKFNTTRKKLETLNNLASYKVKPGQLLLVPSRRSAKSTVAATAAKPKTHRTYHVAQPVQDFDIPASTFASCPVPIPSPDEDTDSPAPVATEKRAPIAKLVSPAEMTAESAPEKVAAPIPPAAGNLATPSVSTNHLAKTAPVYSTHVSPVDSSHTPSAFNPPASKLTSRGLYVRSGPNPLITTPLNDWGNRFLQQARALGNQGIEYDEDWRPPGESQAWAMDCSNTSRYIYKVTTGIQLPRTASDQYYYLHLQGKAWDVPQMANGFADTEYLRHNLKAGDLLFWENTYRPERQPPITHVMVFLGTNDKGEWIMAGSQTSRGGEHNRRNGGPDIYVFRPSQPCGGYTTWMGLVHHQGRFCAYGRPLEADRSKLAVAANM
jgi:cell wall-associated NlpC family hydrolase